jgi:hypothetical protein
MVLFKRRRYCTIQDVNFKDMALKLVQLYDVKNFKASNGWLHKFKTRHNISSKVIRGEAGLIDKNDIFSLIKLYEEKLSLYYPNDIYNCDETGLAYKCTPSRTLCHKDEELMDHYHSPMGHSTIFYTPQFRN